MCADIFFSNFSRTPTLTKDDKLELQNTDPERDLSGRRFLLDRKCKNCRTGDSLMLIKLRGN